MKLPGGHAHCGDVLNIAERYVGAAKWDVANDIRKEK
jgi:hypothetical protein